MRAPDGEVMEVPENLAEKFRQKGAIFVEKGPGGRVRPLYSGAPDEPLQGPRESMAAGRSGGERMGRAALAAYLPMLAPGMDLGEMLIDPTEYPAMLLGGGRGARLPGRMAMPGRGAAEQVQRGASAVGRAAQSPVGRIVGKYLRRRVPEVEMAADLAEAAGGRASLAPASAPVAPFRAAARPSAQYGTNVGPEPRIVRPEPRATIAIEAPAPRTKPVRPRAKAKAKPAERATKVSPTTIKVKPRAARPQQGASTPELVRRTKLRQKAIGRAPSMGDESLEEALRRSIELEQELGGMGIDLPQRAIARRMLRGGGGAAAGMMAAPSMLDMLRGDDPFMEDF